MTAEVRLPDAPAIRGLRIRHYREGDLPAVVEVQHAGRRADGVDWLPSLEGMGETIIGLQEIIGLWFDWRGGDVE